MSLPASSTHPDVGRIRQPAIWSMVVFPEPDGPVIITISPRRTVSRSLLEDVQDPLRLVVESLSTSWSRKTASPVLMFGTPRPGRW